MITILHQPATFATVYNEMMVVVESNNTAEPSFNYIFEICNSSGTTLRTLKIAPEIKYQYGVLDIYRILESYVGTDFFKTNGTGQTRDCDNSFFDYQVKIGESYEVGGVITEFLNLANTSDTCINASLNYNDFLAYDIDDYDLSGITKQFLTEDIDKVVILEQEGHTHFFNADAPTNFRVLTYDNTDTLLQDATFANTATSTIGSFASAPISLNAATLTTGTQPLITSSVAYYDVFAENGGVVSKTYRYYVKSDCGDGVVLHFLNDLGGFDSFPFITYKERFNIEREKFKQNPDRLAADGSYNFSTLDREVVQSYTKKKKMATINTDYLSDEQYRWLIQLVSSPEVYMEKDGVIYSVLITANDYTVNQDYYDDFTFIELDIEFSIEEYRQRF